MEYVLMAVGFKIFLMKAYPNSQMIPVKAGNHKVTFEFKSIYYSQAFLRIISTGLGCIVLLFWLATTG